MILYHGSQHILENPVFHGGRRHNDYGYGFYCTEFPDLAREWSVSRDHDGYLNRYELDTKGLKILNLNEHGILTWLTVLLENRVFQIDTPLAQEATSYLIREFHIDLEPFDIITGYRADDSYFSFARDFINGALSLMQLKDVMHLGEMGDQIVLKSERAHKRIRFLDHEEVDHEIWYARRVERDNKARNAYFRMNRMQYRKGELYMIRILDEEIKRDDARIQ